MILHPSNQLTSSGEEEGRLHRRTQGCCPGQPRTAGEAQDHRPSPARGGGNGAVRHHQPPPACRRWEVGRPQHGLWPPSPSIHAGGGRAAIAPPSSSDRHPPGGGRATAAREKLPGRRPRRVTREGPRRRHAPRSLPRRCCRRRREGWGGG